MSNHPSHPFWNPSRVKQQGWKYDLAVIIILFPKGTKACILRMPGTEGDCHALSSFDSFVKKDWIGDTLLSDYDRIPTNEVAPLMTLAASTILSAFLFRLLPTLSQGPLPLVLFKPWPCHGAIKHDKGPRNDIRDKPVPVLAWWVMLSVPIQYEAGLSWSCVRVI